MIRNFLLVCICLPAICFAQEKYWQQEVNYSITTELNDAKKTLTSFETVVYKNNSPSTLDFIWFHIWPNAYKNSNTALFEQISKDAKRSQKLVDFSYGRIDGLSFKVNNKPATTEPHPDLRYIDIIKLVLPAPLKPGDSVSITTPFTVKLPSYFSRSGFANGEFMVCQWYPKPAVFDKEGWHEFPYLDMGEFYSEYGSYRVNITLPSEYVVGATGSLQTTDELAFYKRIGSRNAAKRDGKPDLYANNSKKPKKVLSYYAANVPDFAFFADKSFIIQYDTLKLSSGKTVDVFNYFHNFNNAAWKNSIDYTKDAVKYYNSHIGEYEYPVVQVVEGPGNNSSGGMEYPMVTIITTPGADVELLDAVIAHEVGHNWFMAMLGSNERMHAWMDEGLNSYYQFRYEAEKYKANSIFGNNIPLAVKVLPLDQFQRTIYKVLQDLPANMPIETPAADFLTSDEYATVTYLKTAVWMYLLEESVGKEKVDQAFKDYFEKWKFKHPMPDDLKQSFERSIGKKLTSFFNLLKPA